MTLLPLDLVLVVGLSFAVFILGLKVWWRNKWATGNALYALLAMTLAFWSTTDWFTRLEASALPVQIFVWKLVFYFSSCLGAGLVTHASAYLARQMQISHAIKIYLLGLTAFLLLFIGFGIRFTNFQLIPAAPFLTAGALLALMIYAAALYFIATDLYPLLHASFSTELARRRATYGLMILLPFTLAGAMQFVIGPLPFSVFIPVLESWFLFFSLRSFIRASFLDVEFSAIESFMIILMSFALLLFLRSRDWTEVVVVAVGSCLVGSFAVIANRSVKGERLKRQFFEKVNREMKIIEDAKNDFLDMVAHQLRGPLGGIRASASMLVSGDLGELPAKAKRNVELIENSATRLLSLADVYLNASRLQIGKFMSVCERIDIRQEIKKIVDELAALALAKNLELKVEINENVPRELEIDVEVLQNVLFNLLDNAIKYTQIGMVMIWAKLVQGNLMLIVKDTGPGMEERELSDLFHKFYAPDANRNHRRDGTGLGLYIAKRLIEAAGGRISVSSEGLGHGLSFEILLPIGKIKKEENCLKID